VGVDERAGRLRLTFLGRVELGPKTSVPFNVTLVGQIDESTEVQPSCVIYGLTLQAILS
jgi:hypothetical protein